MDIMYRILVIQRNTEAVLETQETESWHLAAGIYMDLLADYDEQEVYEVTITKHTEEDMAEVFAPLEGEIPDKNMRQAVRFITGLTAKDPINEGTKKLALMFKMFLEDIDKAKEQGTYTNENIGLLLAKNLGFTPDKKTSEMLLGAFKLHIPDNEKVDTN